MHMSLQNFSEYVICSWVFTVMCNLIIVHDSFEQGEGTNWRVSCATEYYQQYNRLG